MSVAPSEDYIKATKLIESFGCFFEKLSNASNNPNQSANRLSQFKKVLYENLFSTEKLALASEDLCGKALDISKFISRASTHTSTSPMKNSQKFEIQATFSQSRSASHINLQPAFVRSESKQIASQEGANENTQEKISFNTDYLPVTSFLSQVKAASHSEMARLFSLTSNFLYARSFSDHQQPIFTALCFSYFEKLLKEKAKDSQSTSSQGPGAKLSEDIEALDTKETEFSSFLRSFGQNMTESDIMKKYYENLSTSPRLSQSAISVFKQVITKTLQEKDQEISIRGDSFEWMNDIDGITDTAFLQSLAQMFKCTLRFLILTNERLVEKVFHSEKSDSPTSRSDTNILRKELTLFYDKTSKSAFILYPLKRPSDEEYDSNNLQKYKIKPNLLSHPKPPLNSDSLKSLKNLGVEFQNGSLTTLDTLTSPITSLSELENREKQAHSRNTSTRTQQLRKGNTLNVHTSSLNDCSTSFNYPESAVVRPMTEKVIPPSPHSATKDLGHHKFRINENEGDLTPKDKEPVPLRSNSYNNYRESPVVDDKTFNMICEKAKHEAVELSRHSSNPYPELQSHVLGQKPNRETPSRSFFERSSTQEYSSRTYGNENKLKNDYASAKTYSMELNRGEFNYKSTHESPAVIRPSSLPIVLKSKFDRFNQTINNHSQELNNTASKYLKKDSVEQPHNKGMNLGPILSAYQNIMSHTKEISGFRPSIGVALRMDD